MSILTKPSIPAAKNVAVQGIGLAFGYKAGEGLAAAAPDVAVPYRNWIVAGLGFGLAMCISPKTTSGLGVQAGLLGIGASGLVNGATEFLVPAVEAKTGGSSTDKFINAFIGHKEMSVDAMPIVNTETTRQALAMPWESAEPVENIWDRPSENEQKPPLSISLG